MGDRLVLRCAGACSTLLWSTVLSMSKNVIELLVRRSRTEGAPTALDVLKDAVEDHGQVTDDDRRRAAALTGMPEAAVYGVSSYYDDLIQPRGARHIRVCTGTACWAADFDEHVESVKQGFGLDFGTVTDDGAVSLGETVCLGFCHASPAFRDGEAVDAGAGALERVLAGEAVDAEEPEWKSALDQPVLLREGDFTGLRSALATSPEELVATVKEANLRGRGGAGFPAGMKWEFARGAKGAHKFIVVNGDEGDPGSYIDKYLMEQNPEPADRRYGHRRVRGGRVQRIRAGSLRVSAFQTGTGRGHRGSPRGRSPG